MSAHSPDNLILIDRGTRKSAFYWEYPVRLTKTSNFWKFHVIIMCSCNIVRFLVMIRVKIISFLLSILPFYCILLFSNSRTTELYWQKIDNCVPVFIISYQQYVIDTVHIRLSFRSIWFSYNYLYNFSRCLGSMTSW